MAYGCYLDFYVFLFCVVYMFEYFVDFVDELFIYGLVISICSWYYIRVCF